MCTSKLTFNELYPLSTPITIELADGNTIEAKEKGSIGILRDVYYA